MSLRVYGPASADDLRALVAGEPVRLDVVTAVSEDEEQEYDALLAAAERGPAVVAAVVADVSAAIMSADVQAIHVDADGSGDLAWYAPQEIDQVIAILEGAG